MNIIHSVNGSSVRSPRAAILRTKDAHFDALCETYLDLCQRISKLNRSAGAKKRDIDILEDQRANCLDTIAFILADEDATSHKHRLH